MRRTVIALAILVLGSGQALAADPRLDEVRAHFTISHKPVPPEALGDLGADDLADPGHSLRVTVDLLRAIGADGYPDKIEVGEKGWISQAKTAAGGQQPAEAVGYKFVGATRSGLLVTLSSFWGGGSGRFYTLQILDAGIGHAFDADGKLYERLTLTAIRNISLGDRWQGSVTIRGDALVVLTKPGEPNNSQTEPSTQTIPAVRPD